MSVNVNYIKELVYDLAAKQSQAFPSPADFNNYAQLANIDLFNFYNDERDKMLLKVRTGDTLFMPSVLDDFLVRQQPLTASSGAVTLPTDNVYNLAVTTTDDITIKKTDIERLSTYLNSTIDLPTATNPIYVQGGTIIQVYPTTVGFVKLSYLRQPATPVWAYTMVNNRPVYNSSGSVNFEWQSTEVLRLASRVLAYMGISIKDDMLAKQAQQMVLTAS